MTSDQYFAEAEAEGRMFGFVLMAITQRNKLTSMECAALFATRSSMLHDCNPPTRFIEQAQYSGDGGKAIVELRLEALAAAAGSQLDIAVGNFDAGLGVVMKRPVPRTCVDVQPMVREALTAPAL